MQRSAEFFSYARERYNIMLRRDADEAAVARGEQPQGPPWTEDNILQQFRFCNVFREDDKVTKYIRQKITFGGYGNKIVQALTIARWFNRPTTIDLLLPPEGCDTPYFEKNMLYMWDSKEVWRRLKDVHPLVTGAFMVKTPAKMSKLEGLVWCIEQALPVCEHVSYYILAQAGSTPRLETVCKMLQRAPYLGPFMAYEVVTDLRHTDLLRGAPDVMTWANPGPGCARGAGRVNCGDKDYFSLGNSTDRAAIQNVMAALLEMSRDPEYWPAEWPAWEMREVEHTLCEFDKYERAWHYEGTPKQRFNGGAA